MSFKSVGTVRSNTTRGKIDAEQFVGEYAKGKQSEQKEVLMSRVIVLSLIVAMTTERVIGNKGKLPWRYLPSDLAHFKKVTSEAGTVIMGRVTYESILARNSAPLPTRNHIVLTKKYAPSTNRAVTFVGSIEEAYAEVADGSERACVIGGAEIYNLFLPSPYLLKMYITIVNAQLPGDVSFPQTRTGLGTEWTCTKMSPMQKWHPRDEYETSCGEYERS